MNRELGPLRAGVRGPGRWTRTRGQPVGALPGKLREARWSGEDWAWRRVSEWVARGSCGPCVVGP